MRSAAIRVLCLVVLALGGVFSSAAVAGVQLDPIGTVTSAISTIVSQTTVVSDLTDSATSGATSGGSGATGAVSGAAGAVSGSGSLSSGGGGSGSSGSSGDGSARSAAGSNRGSPRTRFDRLPRRYERLLERIESGRHVRANLARLRALLASASPQLRARVMRLIRREIRRLERGGLTRRERAAVHRLRTLLTSLQGPASRPATQRPLSLGREGSGILPATAAGGGVATAAAGSEPGLAGHPPTSGREGAGNATPGLRLPSLLPPSSPPYLALLLLILAAITCLLLLLTGHPRHLLPSPVRGIVEVRRPQVLALAVVIGVGLVMGLMAVLLVQTVLF